MDIRERGSVSPPMPTGRPQGPPPPPPPTPRGKPGNAPGFRWEYRSTLLDRDADLSQFGSEGWECYSVVAAPADQATFYFRRRR